ncbi:TBCC domain-containing protein 1 [Camellia lanceoleosa]|uniref:TBCC domain-containing protein 1 n=1 Tax=Camellia lanceoleosa TaxID=1840588 RepID=A0ACC0GBF7_9ERIC|nr:TBCC domain-containing protein 1 [Camellia lanceoleosa]
MLVYSHYQVLTMEKFEHLEFLIYFGGKGSERIPLSQAAPFVSNSDPDMPAAPVSATLVHDWLLQKISSALEHISERVSAKENGSSSASDQDVAMADACVSSIKALTSARDPSFIEGISKSSYVKQASDLKGSSVKVINCHESVIYILAPLRYATIYGCSDTTIVLGAVGNVVMKNALNVYSVRVEHCEQVHVIVEAKRICIAKCRECVFLLLVTTISCRWLPYNTFYSQLETHMDQVGIEATINRWDDPVIPNWFEGESSGSTKADPFLLPNVYMSSQHRNRTACILQGMHQEISGSFTAYKFKPVRFCLAIPEGTAAAENLQSCTLPWQTYLCSYTVVANAIAKTFANSLYLFFFSSF